MIETLWFLKQNDDIVGVFDDYDIALEEKEYLKTENIKDGICLSKKIISNLTMNSEEYKMAKERDYL